MRGDLGLLFTLEVIMGRKGCKFCGEDKPCGNKHCPFYEPSK